MDRFSWLSAVPVRGEKWGRSATESVDVAGDQYGYDDLELGAEACSGTMLELFWQRQAESLVGCGVRREGQLLYIADGNCFVDSAQ